MVDFQIIGGIALTIFGARFLRKGMDRLFGNRMTRWVASAAEKPHHAIVGGLAAGWVNDDGRRIGFGALTVKPVHTSIYLDFLNALRRINSHLNTIARNFSSTDRPPRKCGQPPATNEESTT